MARLLLNDMNVAELKSHIIKDYGHSSRMPLLALLEYPFEDAKKLIASTYKASGIPESEVEAFDFDRIIVMAFDTEGSGYWAELAAGWLEQGARMSEEIARAVYSMVERKLATQRARHRAYRMVKRWERSRTV